MTAIHIHLTVQQMPSGKWVGTIRREGGEMPYALTRPHEHRRDAERWVLEQAREELSGVETGSAA